MKFELGKMEGGTMDLNNLVTEIAAYRFMMNRLSKGKSLSDPDVIRLRQGLDSLIHQYYFKFECIPQKKKAFTEQNP